VADELAGHGDVAGWVGGGRQACGVEQAEAEALVHPVPGSVAAPARVGAERRRLRGPGDQMLDVAPRQPTAVIRRFHISSVALVLRLLAVLDSSHLILLLPT